MEPVQESSLPLVKRRGRRKASTLQEIIQEGQEESKLRKPRKNNQLPKEIIFQETSEIILRREFSSDDMVDLIGKLLAGPNHAYVAELKITQTK